MAEGLLGRKRGMTQIFSSKGHVIPVTVLEVGPCYVTHIRTNEKEGYTAIQIGYDETRRLNKPERGHLKNLPSLKHLREVRTSQIANFKVGQKLNAALFETGERVDVTGISKGKGTAGGVKRYHFRGGPKTHGQSDRLRRPGSSSATTTPGRVLKGTRRAGRMGAERVTASNLEVIQVDTERNLVVVRGAVPGAKNGLIFIKKARKLPKGKK
ncbi:MAG: 50S ribosomal protein L3 [Chloroflexi bacterium UTCFX4]|jgi:large subunit ribosomal protein L3|nr:MAG: 50S ribosomal protein L3 [Chloroflexi bacterium UTCFX4]